MIEWRLTVHLGPYHGVSLFGTHELEGFNGLEITRCFLPNPTLRLCHQCGIDSVLSKNAPWIATKAHGLHKKDSSSCVDSYQY